MPPWIGRSCAATDGVTNSGIGRCSSGSATIRRQQFRRKAVRRQPHPSGVRCHDLIGEGSVMLGWAPIAAGVIPAFGSEDPLEPVERCQWYHRTITQAAAEAEGWSSGAADELGRHTLGVDLYAYHPIWCAQGGPRRWRGVRLARPALVNVHFDNLADGHEITEIWHRITGGLVVAIAWA